ncbi:hypothetical protein [Paracoccus laeviglucosivorans]|uniref:hypothetical protein n=1 Tax=Paracoccus laeviglucosivorans TaxID=1197861 RepID=UPI00115AFDA7|nr:hypothetical protein [Paracoccus laeviglucosivorans]
MVQVDELKALLASGWLFCIYCKEPPEIRGVHVHGLWYVFAIEPTKREEWVALVTQRGRRIAGATYAFREFRTPTPIFRMCDEFGYPITAYPTKAGQSLIIEKPN